MRPPRHAASALLLLVLIGLPATAGAECLPLDPRQPEGNFIVPGTLGGIVYKRTDDGPLGLDLYVQQGRGPRPLAVVVHGGGGSGSRVAFVGQFLELLTEAGFHWASIDYRLRSGEEAAAEDVRDAAAFLRCHADRIGLDPARLVLLGEDTSGSLVSHAAALARPPAAAVVIVGGRFTASAARVPDDRPVPHLIVHGGDDREVPIAEAETFCAEVRRSGGECRLLRVDGASHRAENWWPRQWGYKRRLVEWLEARVGRPGPHRPRESRLRKRIPFDPAERLHLDAWHPDGRGPFPAVIVVHGGGWEAGDRVTYVTPLFATLAEAGVAWVSIDYRLTPQVRHPAQLDDLRHAIAWVRANAAALRIDPSRLVLLGESASGQMVMQVALEDPALAGVISFYGVYDFIPIVTDASPRSLLVRLFGHRSLNDEARAVMRRYSPVYHVRRGMPPVLLIHGTNEQLWDQGVAMAAALERAGVTHQLVKVDGAPHGLENWEGHPEWTRYKAVLIEWLRRVTGRGTTSSRRGAASLP